MPIKKAQKTSRQAKAMEKPVLKVEDMEVREGVPTEQVASVPEVSTTLSHAEERPVFYAAPRPSSLVVDDRVLPDSGLPTEFVQGILDIANEGSGLLRPTFHSSDRDVYISGSQIRRFSLRVGDLIGGQARRPKENERYWGLLKVEKVNGFPIDEVGERPYFDDLVAVYPDAKITLSPEKAPLSTRVIDLV